MQYSKFVKPAFDDFILPTKKYADIIIPRGGDNHVAIDLIVQHIRTKLGQHDLCKIYPNLYVIHSTFQVPFQVPCYIIVLHPFIFGITLLLLLYRFLIGSCLFSCRYVACIHLYVMLKQQNMILCFMLID